MIGTRKTRLTDAGIARLKPATGEYTVWDTRMPNLGVRVRPSGHRGYVYQGKVDGRAKRLTLGPAALKTVAQARRECLEIKVAENSGNRARIARGETPTFASFVAGPWKSACFDRYKPATQKSVRGSLRTQLLPTFGDLSLDCIDRRRVNRWFDDYSRAAPGGANHALDDLRRIMNHAIALGHIETNPTRDIKPNPRTALTRFLTREEIARLHRVLDGHASDRASRRRQANIIRLLLLTGCRKGEIVNLRWREADGDTLNLADSKTGPRKVFLNAPARAIIERQAQTESPFVFPSPRDPERACSPNLPLWYTVRPASRDRGRSPSRFTSYLRQPRRVARHPTAGCLAPAGSQAAKHDAALCPRQRPGDRGSGRTNRRSYRAGAGYL